MPWLEGGMSIAHGCTTNFFKEQVLLTQQLVRSSPKSFLRLTGSVEQPLSKCDLWDDFEAVDLLLYLRAFGTRPNTVDRLN